MEKITAVIERISATGMRLLTFRRPAGLKLRGALWTMSLVAVLLVVIMLVLVMLWGREPSPVNMRDAIIKDAGGKSEKLVAGYMTTEALVRVAKTLLDKPGGYISNDIMPPMVFMDDIKNWELGVLVQIRDLARVLRNDLSRSQSQSLEDPDLAEAETLFNFSNHSWWLPATEDQYRMGIEHLQRYLTRLTNADINTQFHARADNLSNWLAVVGTRLGSLSQRLGASVGQARIDATLLGEAESGHSIEMVKTDWLEIDDIFYETRGTTWALVHFFHAVEDDFGAVLRRKNAVVSIRQIIRELEATQSVIWSPMVLNGSGFGFVTNYSLIMVSYIARANSAIIDLRNLLAEG